MAIHLVSECLLTTCYLSGIVLEIEVNMADKVVALVLTV